MGGIKELALHYLPEMIRPATSKCTTPRATPLLLPDPGPMTAKACSVSFLEAHALIFFISGC